MGVGTRDGWIRSPFARKRTETRREPAIRLFFFWWFMERGCVAYLTAAEEGDQVQGVELSVGLVGSPSPAPHTAHGFARARRGAGCGFGGFW